MQPASPMFSMLFFCFNELLLLLKVLAAVVVVVVVVVFDTYITNKHCLVKTAVTCLNIHGVFNNLLVESLFLQHS